MLSATTLLDVWERGGDRAPPRQALLLLEAAHPEATPGELARLSVGRRDALLLDLRERAFGPHFESVAECPRCGEWLELSFDAADVRNSSPGSAERLAVALGGYAVTFRLLNSEDVLDALSDRTDNGKEVLVRQLLMRCVESAEHDGTTVSAAELPDDVVDAIAEEMEAADPQANVTVLLTCPACQQEWEQLFDVASFLWAEVETWARRTIGEVHALASAYGWTEREVLGLTAQRRRLYLQRVQV